MYDNYVCNMRERIKSYIRRKFFKDLGPALTLVTSPKDMSVLWKQEKHRTFSYNPDDHSYVDEDERTNANDMSGAEHIGIGKLFLTKDPIELKLAKDSIALTFAELEKISSTMAVNYQTEQF